MLMLGSLSRGVLQSDVFRLRQGREAMSLPLLAHLGISPAVAFITFASLVSKTFYIRHSSESCSTIFLEQKLVRTKWWTMGSWNNSATFNFCSSTTNQETGNDGQKKNFYKTT
jgi:hypothetical protein